MRTRKIVVATLIGLVTGAATSEAQDAAKPGAPAERPPAAARQPASRPQAAPPPPAEPAQWQGRYPGQVGIASRTISPEDVAQQASSVLQIESDGAYGPYGGGSTAIDARTAASVLRSSPVVEGAIKKALSGVMPGQRWQEFLVVNAVPTGARFLEVEVILLKSDPHAGMDDARAKKLLAALCEALEGALRESAEGPRQASQKRREKAEADVASARQRLAEVRVKLREYRAATSAVSQLGDARYAANNLRGQRQQYEQQVVGYRARLKALRPTASPLVEEWRGVVELREKELDALTQQMSAGKAAKEAVEAQERRLAEAKSQLETSRRSAAESDPDRARGGEVASTEANLAQAELQLKTLGEQLAKLEDPKTLEMLDEIPELQNEESRTRNELNEAVNRADQLRRGADSSGEVTVRVLDGMPDQ